MGFFYPQWQKITRIGVTTPPTTTGYQVKVEIPWQPGMRDDFADLRFSDYYRTLPYWIETSTTRSTATVWIKLTEINSAASEFFCYYGNGGASSESNGDNVFEVFDHFDAASVDTNKWTVTGSPTITNSILSFTAGQGIASKTLFGINVAIRERDANTKVTASHVGFADGVSNYFIIRSEVMGAARRVILAIPPNARSASLTDVDTNYHIYELRRNTSSLDAYIDNVSAGTYATAPTTQLPAFINVEAATSGSRSCDWVAVRKYQSTEPTCTPAEGGINTAFYQAVLRAKHIIQDSYPYTLAVSFITDHMHLTWTEP